MQEKTIIAAAREMTMEIERLSNENLNLQRKVELLTNIVNKDSDLKLELKSIIRNIEYTRELSLVDYIFTTNKILSLKNKVQ